MDSPKVKIEATINIKGDSGERSLVDITLEGPRKVANKIYEHILEKCDELNTGW